MIDAITVSTGELLSRVEQNRARHRVVFEDALAGYKTHCLQVLEDHVRQIGAGQLPEIRIALPRPKDHTRDYDRVIGMLKMHAGDTITVGEDTYAQYVDDDWDWKRQWLGTASSYAPKSVSANYGIE